MSTQIEAIKRWVEVFDGNWHDEPVDSEWADRAHQALAEMRQAIAEAEQPAQQEPAYRCRPYSNVPGAKVSAPVDYFTTPQAQPRGEATLAREPLTLPPGRCASEWGGRATGPCLYTDDEVFEILAAHGITKGNT